GTGNVSGGTTPYTTTWNSSPVQTGLIASNLPAGGFVFSVQDANGCTATANITITEPPALSFNHTETNPLCSGNANGSIIFSNPTGGNGTFTYSIDGGTSFQASPSFPNLASGNYNLVLRDGNGCLSPIVAVSLSDPNQLAVTEIHTDISCFGGNDGQVNISPTGGVLPYSFSWSNGALTEDIQGLPIGLYAVTVSDANNCTVQISATLLEPPALLLSETHQDILCFGQSTGSIDLVVSGGTSPYSYSWNSGQLTQDLSTIPAGTYIQNLTDANGCTATLTAILSEPASALTATETNTGVSCFGVCDGSIDVTTSGGTAPYSFSWSNSATTEDISALCIGNYTLSIVDANACPFNLPVIISGPAAPLSATQVPGYVFCNGDNTGSIDVTTTGGTTPYSYVWNNGAVTEDLTNIIAGTYDVTISDANSCTFSLTIPIYQPPVLVLTETHVDVACFGQSTASIDVLTSGGDAPYTYLWSNSATTEDLTNIGIGTYTQTVTDNLGCQASVTITINQPAAALNATETNTPATCFGYCNGTIDVTTTGGTSPYTFTWSTGELTEDIANVCAGNPSLDIIDLNGCTFNLPVTITQPANGVSFTETHTDALCFGSADGSIDVTSTGGTPPYQFSWDNGATSEDISALSANQYNLTVTDQNSCVFTFSVTIAEPNLLTQAENHQDVLCFGQSTGSIDLSVSGGTQPYLFAWSNAATTEDLSNLPTGNYTVSITDANNCISGLNVFIAEPSAPLNVTETHTNATCFGFCDATVDITSTGGTSPYSYYWTNNQTVEDPTGLCAGAYGVIVTDNNGCPFTLPVTITEPAQPIAITGTTIDASCFGGNNGTIDITVTGGTPTYTYSWTNNAGNNEDPINLVAGNYTVTVVDQTGVCTLDQTFTILEPTEVVVTASPDQTICISNSTTISANAAGGVGPYTYSWTSLPGDPSLTAGANSQNPSVSPTANTTYSVTATDAAGCVSTLADDVVINLMEPLNLSLTVSGSNPICLNESSEISFSATGGDGNYAYLLDNSTIVQSPYGVTPLTTTTYSVEVSDGCGTPSQTATVTITVNPLPDIQLSANVTEGCEDLRVNLVSDITNCTGAVWDWNFGDNGPNAQQTTFSGSTTYVFENPGTFTISITATSTDNCVNSAVFTDYITVHPEPVAGFIGKPQITTIMEPSVEFVDESIGASTWYYEFLDDASTSADTNPVHTYRDTGIFIVQQTVITEFGCTDYATDTIEIRPVYSMYIPNAFTPNGNYQNELYSMVGEGYIEGTFEMFIYNRWGEELYRTRSLEHPWDGKDRTGKECPLGVYVYLARVKSGEDKKYKTYSGHFTLVR
ncbi:MAG: gliding motility-associated C-terminal domain-containing protein, partial [Bacteroidia bacterium]|nr:gliding motility-associated C-terminal domain-containing protein [Bacteroidia bacterium]